MGRPFYLIELFFCSRSRFQPGQRLSLQRSKTVLADAPWLEVADAGELPNDQAQ
jgi:hypothetical protein